VVTGHDEEPPGERRQGRGVEYRRAEQRQRCDAVGIAGREALQIAGAAPAEMRRPDPELIEKLGEAALDRPVLLG
jgi:hypothetical protein